jgi:hypothetical protein
MSLLSPADQDKLRTAFDEMTSPVRVLFFTQTLDCETCLQTRQILDELPPLSDKIAIEEVNFILDRRRRRSTASIAFPRSRWSAETATRGSDFWARRPATSSSRSSRRSCWWGEEARV